MNKKAIIHLSIRAIAIFILAILFLSLGLSFIRRSFKKTSLEFEEELSTEPEPPIADVNTPITISRELITTLPDNHEIIKVNIHNPTDEDWQFRDAISIVGEEFCGVNDDSVCFIDVANQDCDDKSKDNDCKPKYNCTQNSELGEGIGCVMVLSGDKTYWDNQGFCSFTDSSCDCSIDGYGIGFDPDCGPTEEVRLKIECSEDLQMERITNPKEIKAGSSTQFSALLRIDRKAKQGDYLCKVGVAAFITKARRYEKELVINVK